MQLSKNVISFCFLFMMLCLNIIFLYAYEYPPVKRSSEEWKHLSPDEKHAICQIPDNILSTMSTEDLIQAYLDYPYLAIIAAYDNWMTGFYRVYQDFNGLRELLKREDASRKIIQFYKKMDPGAYSNDWTLYNRGRFAVNFTYIEILLAQERIIQQFNPQEVNEYLIEGIKKYNLKEKHIQLHGMFGLELTAFPMARLMQMKSSVTAQKLLQIPDMEYFLNTAHTKNKNVLPFIIQLAKENNDN